MNMTMQELADRFIENRDAVRDAFRLENEYIYPVCAQIYLAANKPVEREQLARCKDLVKSTTGLFSNFRGNVKLPLLCMLASTDEPAERWDRTQRYYAALKDSFSGSQYLALAALLLSDTVQEADISDLALRGRALYQSMRKAHPFLTGQEDSVFALLLAQSPRSDEALVEDMEACYRLLDEQFPKGDGLQTASHVLALSKAAPEEKVGRMLSLFDAILFAGGKYGKDRQLPILAALSLGGKNIDDLVQDMLELDGLLAQKKGYRGIFGMDRRTRIMHAAMLLSLPEKSTGLVNAAAQQTTLAMIAAQQALMCAVVASSAASSASSSSAH